MGVNLLKGDILRKLLLWDFVRDHVRLAERDQEAGEALFEVMEFKYDSFLSARGLYEGESFGFFR